MKILSIDAWRDCGGWTWNNWHNIGEFPNTNADLLDNPRALLAWFRDNDFLSAESAGKVAIDDDGYNVVIVARDTREPLYALEYGALDTIYYVLREIDKGVIAFNSDIGVTGSTPNTNFDQMRDYLRNLYSDKICYFEVIK